MSSDLLQHIQALQFSDKGKAEELTLAFIRDTFPLDVVGIDLRPLAVSLNSFNGFVRLSDGKRLFFKTHTETDTVIGEYYQANLLAEAAYPIIQPLYRSTEVGKQLLIYEVIEDPSVFDLSWDIESGKSDLLSELTLAQQAADEHLLSVYRKTLQRQTAQDAAQAPVHQLFYHRLFGGRLTRFYGTFSEERVGKDVSIHLPGKAYSMWEVSRAKWVINGQVYKETLYDLIGKCEHLLAPSQAGPAIIGHGDAHNGNIFFRHADVSLLYFDPAFAGTHHPLLDLVKPLFHNIFAMWMYFPQVKRECTQITFHHDGSTWQIDHDYALHPVREMFLRSKVERVLVPILVELKHRGWLREDWREYLKAGLFCCPLLTMNLTDARKFSPEISLLGLTMAVEMGAESHGQRSVIDLILDEISTAIQ